MTFRIYVSGSISGIHDGNRPAFEAAQKALALRYPYCTIVNPFDNGLTAESCWEQHMRADIKMLMDCDAICALSGYTKSKGAMIEMDLAVELGMRLGMLEDWLK